MSSLRDRFTEVLHQVGREDPRVVVLVADISHFRLQPFAKDCPGRYYNVGICEPTMVNMAAGLAKVGFFPVVHTISTFIVERSFEQIKLDFCYQKLGGNLVAVGSAFDYTQLGCTHRCASDFALLKTLPHTQLFYPSTFLEFDQLFRQTYHNGELSYFRIPKFEHNHAFNREEIVWGKGIKVHDGEDLTMIAVGTQLKSALGALPALKDRGVNCDLIYIHTVKPLDEEMVLQSLIKTRKCLVIEEHGNFGGVFDHVLSISKNINGVRYSALNIPNEFLRGYGTYEDHCAKLGLTPTGILNQVAHEFHFKGMSQVFRH